MQENFCIVLGTDWMNFVHFFPCVSYVTENVFVTVDSLDRLWTLLVSCARNMHTVINIPIFIFNLRNTWINLPGAAIYDKLVFVSILTFYDWQSNFKFPLISSFLSHFMIGFPPSEASSNLNLSSISIIKDKLVFKVFRFYFFMHFINFGFFRLDRKFAVQ